jgi:hypothetical protein
MKFIAIARSYLFVECFLALCIAAWAGFSAAQGAVYRCDGNEYVASVKDSKNGGCKLLEGGNVTVVQGTRSNNSVNANNAVQSSNAPSAKASSTSSSSSSGNQRNDSAEQKSRDSDSRNILETELKKAEAKQAELLKEYNNGEPEKTLLELKNPQRYAERLAEMKANIARNDSDIAGIKRELGRNQTTVVRSN